MLYAHSVEGRPEDEWEPLDRHLANVGEGAAKNAKPFGGDVLARVEGLLHDVGKVDPDYQGRRLYGEAVRIDHSTAGAVLAVERYGPVIGRMMAYAIAGHHAGLANGSRAGGGTTPLTQRLKAFGRVEVPAGLADTPPLSGLSKADLPVPMRKPGCTPEFTLPFLVRMLFSALVDADFLETEKFYTGSGRPACGVGVAELAAALSAHMEDKASKAGDTRVNRLRAGFLRDCVAAAERAPGVFTVTGPTGIGKTLGVSLFALLHAVLHAERHGKRRYIYLAPYTSIIEQTAEALREALGHPDAVLEHHSNFDAAVLGGEGEGERKLRAAAENWDRPVVVSTVVQFFESLFANRPSRCRKLHNIVNSVIVLDEAQKLPVGLLLPCIAAMKELVRNYGCTVVLSTATQPALRVEDGFADGFADTSEIVSDPAGLAEAMRRVRYEVMPEPASNDDLLSMLADEPQALVVVNSRRHARDLYRLVAAVREDARHLSTWMCAAHRKDVLAEIRRRLDPRAGLPVLLVATSLIEAGVDIDFPKAFRALAGIDSIGQTGGRTNREGLLGGLGTVHVFEPDPSMGYNLAGDLREAANAAGIVLRGHPDDPVGIDAVRAYFKAIYWSRRREGLDDARVGEDPDGPRGILRALADHAGTLDWPFADVARAFRIIEDVEVPLIVPYRGVEPVLGELARAKYAAGLARKLQRFVVGMPRDARDRLVASGDARVLRADDFGDQFVLLENHALYSGECGLTA